MATASRLEEGYEMDSIQQETRYPQQHADTTPGHSGHGQSVVPPGAPSEESLGHSKFRRDFDIKNAAPKGWPSIAATQMYYNNFNLHRRYSYLMQRVLVDQETKLAYLENKLDELDKEDDPVRLKSLSFDPDRLLTTCVRAPAQAQSATTQSPSPGPRTEEQEEHREENPLWKDKDLLLEATMPRLKSYIELLQLDKEMQKLPPISRREHRVFYDEIRKYHTLDESAYQFLYSNDDFVTTVTDRVHQYFEALVYGDSPIISVSSSPSYFWYIRLGVKSKRESSPTNSSLSRKYIKRFIGRVHNNHGQDHAPAIEIDKRLIIIPLKVTVAFASGVLLLSPVAILFLGNLTKVGSFGVVVGFMFLFVAVMSWLNTNWHTILVGLSAYMAVLVTFLSNLSLGRD
ncbi:hypothetical protein K449DRAFT_434992 [Hypoxylon sp. EC38]|nr:hypothetical protein K449DRAFT_434992 [Hypoxylon sp. EC38]